MFKRSATFLLSLALVVSVLMPCMAVSTAQASDGHTNWAILISGGIDIDNNHARYWNDISEMYEILTGTYGYWADDIMVLYADGNPPTAANCHDYDKAWGTYPTNIIDCAATTATLDTVTDFIAANGNCGDTLFVFSTDHGGSNGNLFLWGASISPATFAGPGYMGKITQYSWRAFEMEQCFSGAFVAPLSGPRTLIATACRDDETSCGAGADLYYYDPFCYYFNAALKGALPTPAGGTAVDADANDDGKVSFVEAFNYAEANDYCVEEPQYDDNGDGTSQTGQMPSGGDGAFGATVFLAETFNQPPVADAGPDQTVERTSAAGAQVTLDGSGSYDCDNGPQPLTYNWAWTGGSATGKNPIAVFPMGTKIVTLTVSDGEFSDTDTVNITVQDTIPPPAPTLLSPVNGIHTNDNTVALDWSDVSDLSTPVKYQVWVDNNSNFSSLEYNSGAISVSSDTTSALADNTYYWKARAKDGVGNIGAWSTVWQFTVDTTPPAPVNDLNICDQTLNSVTLCWTAPGDDGNVGTATTYDIRYSTSPINNANWNMATQCTGEPAPQPAGSPQSFVVPNIVPGSDYYFALKTADEVSNWSALSNIAFTKWVKVDIKPCVYPNTIRLSTPFSEQYVQVAVLSTSLAKGEPADFDANKVDPAQVRFGVGKAKPAGWYLFDLRCPPDFDNDLILTFKVADAGLTKTDTRVILTGKTYDGTLFYGVDSIKPY